MDLTDASSWMLIPLQILIVDLLLGADNALVIALACRGLPPKDVSRATAIGVLGAVVLRLMMTMVATSLLAVPLVKIIGALALTVIALNIEVGGPEAEDTPRASGAANLWAAAGVIVLADTTMSLDNVVALAAIARGNFWLLAIGVALSLPLLGYGGVLLTRWLQKAPYLVAFGAALLGWIAGDMAVSDPLVAGWADVNAPGLVAFAPPLLGLFVFLVARLDPPRPAPAARVAAPVAVAAPAPVAAKPARPPVAAPPPPPPPRAPAATPAPATVPYELAEPDDRSEPPAAPATRDDRLAIIGVLLLAIAAGAILMYASVMDSFN